MKARLTSDDPPGWYLCKPITLSYHKTDADRCYWWNGRELRSYEGGHFYVDMNLYENIRGPLILPTGNHSEAAEQI